MTRDLVVQEPKVRAEDRLAEARSQPHLVGSGSMTL